ncbi:MAG: CAAX protease [Elainellaceae cyanobacterium]
MFDSTLRFWDLVGWTFALSRSALRDISALPQGIWIAAALVLLAGLSQAIAQAIVLFINRVRPLRFVLSLVVNGVLFAAGSFFLIASTWLITLLPWSENIPFRALATILGISYAPLIFSFFGALPYLGVPILTLLSVWHLLAMVVGFSAVSYTGFGTSLSHIALGWVVLQILQNTVGQPVANFGNRLANAVAGVELVTERRDILTTLRDRISEIAWTDELQQRLSSLRGAAQRAVGADGVAHPGHAGQDISLTATEADPSAASAPRQQRPSRNRIPRTLLGLAGMLILTGTVVVTLRPIRAWLPGLDGDLPELLGALLDFTWVGIIGIVVAGLLAPLETLGWWAGWYNDEIDVTVNAGDLVTPKVEAADPRTSSAESPSVSRYVVYLDGIGKSTFEYLPDIEDFLDALGRSLPPNVALIRGIMPYSVLNNPLDEDRPLAFLWKLADEARFANPMALLGLLVNIRNILIVGVSADRRYGPLYNHGVAQVVFNGLMKNGYDIGSSTPITLIGYSGGGQISCACAPVLKRALSAPIDVISLGGVISGNCNILKLEQLYHLVGDRDVVERVGPVMFPGRWRLFFLSYWNRAKRYGNISIVSLGPVGHQVPGGILDPERVLPNGKTALQQTLDHIIDILRGDLLPAPDLSSVQLSNYERYRQAPFNRPSAYPIRPPAEVCREYYRPVAPWIGRLILPERSQRWGGVWFEVYHAPGAHAPLIGQAVALEWSRDPAVQRWVRAATKDLHFSADAEHSSIYGGLVHPDRLNHWQQVNPLESLAGAHPVDDIVVALSAIQVASDAPARPLGRASGVPSTAAWTLYTSSEPVQITGRYYALVQFIQRVGEDGYRVVHFNRRSRQFDGPAETVVMPPVVADQNGCLPSSRQHLEQSPLNERGWYIYGVPNASDRFVVQSLAPRSLLSLQPDRVLFCQTAYRHIRHETWDDIVAQKGKVTSVLCAARDSGAPDAVQTAIDEWQVGDRALVLHVYGGIGGEKREPAAAGPVFFGHFAYGVATVVRDPLADELRFEIQYHQIYTHNTDGLIAGTLHWNRYMGDRQFGWAGTRPVCDLLVKLNSFTDRYDIDGGRRAETGPIGRSPLSMMVTQLSAMAARYRIGDGTGGTYVGPANNCSQDSNRALFATLERLENALQGRDLDAWIDAHPGQKTQLGRVVKLGADLQAVLQPFGSPRPDWEKNEYNLGSTLEDEPIRNLIMGLGSWRTLLPRKASDAVVKVFLAHGASVWVLRTNQIGGYAPDIEPIAPVTL